MTDGCVNLLYNSGWKFHQLAAGQLAAGQLLSGQPLQYGKDRWYGPSTAYNYKITPARSLSGPPCWVRPLAFGLIALQRTNTKNCKQIFPEKKLPGQSPNFHIHVQSVSDLYIPTIDLPILLQEICGPILGIHKSLTNTRMWKLGLRQRNSQKRNT